MVTGACFRSFMFPKKVRFFYGGSAGMSFRLVQSSKLATLTVLLCASFVAMLLKTVGIVLLKSTCGALLSRYCTRSLVLLSCFSNSATCWTKIGEGLLLCCCGVCGKFRTTNCGKERMLVWLRLLAMQNKLSQIGIWLDVKRRLL